MSTKFPKTHALPERKNNNKANLTQRIQLQLSYMLQQQNDNNKHTQISKNQDGFIIEYENNNK